MTIFTQVQKGLALLMRKACDYKIVSAIDSPQPFTITRSAFARGSLSCAKKILQVPLSALASKLARAMRAEISALGRG